MEIEQFLEDSTLQNRSFLENTPDFKTCNYVSESMSESNNGQSSCFDCNICLDSVHDPVVTLCGHLFCWPCIYKWLSFETNSLERQDRQRCPVCKAQVSHSTLVPLYGKGSTEQPSKSKSLHLGIVIPRRPLAPTSCGNESPRSYTHTTTSQHNGYSVRAGNYNSHSSSSEGLGPGQTMTSLLSPMNGGFGQMVYARAFGNDITNLYAYPNSHDLYRSVNSPRVRRLIMETDKSLNRICLFLFCCLILCLLTF